jgi:UDP-2,3-diacylglucosamine pyrophosphatase LpxH
MSNISGSMPQTEKNSFLRNLQEIDNIRPFSAIFKWLFYQVRKNQDLKEIINDSIKETVRNFDNLRFPDNWRMGCNKSPNLVLAMKLKALAKILKYLNISALESIINIYSSIFTASASPDSSDDVLNRGATAFLSRRSDYRYLVMGHTHNPLQMPVKVTGSGEDQIYVNTGTWRKKYFQGTAGGFVGLKYLTYAVFYDREENPSQKFEVWTGTLKEEEKWPR